MSVIWQDPPRRRPSRVSWLIEANDLRSHPKRWGLVHERSKRSAQSMAWQINRGELQAFTPAGDFEACARDGAVFARYLGDGDV